MQGGYRNRNGECQMSILSDPWFYVACIFGCASMTLIVALAHLNEVCDKREREIANLKAFIDIKIPRHVDCQCGLRIVK